MIARASSLSVEDMSQVSLNRVRGREQSQPRPWRRLLPLILAAGSSQAVLAVLGPTVVAIAEEFHVSVGLAGQARTITAATAVMASVAIAGRMDRRRLPRMLRVGAALVIVACIGVAVSPTLWTFLLSHVVMGLGFAYLVSAGFAGIAAFDRETRSWAAGFVTASIAGAWIAVNPVAGILTDSMSWRAAYLAPALIALCGFFSARYGSTPGRDTSLRGERERTGSLREVASLPSARRWIVAELTYYTAWGTFLTFSGAFFIEVLGTSESTVGWLLALGPAAFVLSATTQSPALAKRFPRPRVVTVTVFSIGLLLVVLLVMSRSVMVAAGLNVLIGAAAGLRTPLSSTLGLAQLPDLPGAMMSVRTAVNQLGYLFAGLIGGVVIATWGYAALGLVLAVILGISGLLFLRVREPATPEPH
jgi:predicted MFS family arabinose efflux permease